MRRPGRVGSISRRSTLPALGPLIALGAFAIHQVRYVVGLGSAAAENTLVEHGLLSLAAPLLAGLALAALTAALLLRAGDRRGERARRSSLTYLVGLAAVLLCQELIEWMLSSCHADALAAIFSTKGWAALPLAVLVGVLAVLVERGIGAVGSRFPTGMRRLPRPPAGARLAPCDRASRPRLSPLALGLAERPPPRAL